MSAIPSVRSKWVAMFAKLVCPMNQAEAAAAIAAMLPMMQDLPDGAFGIGSLEYVASQCRRGVPTYGELRSSLTAWWADHKPAQFSVSDDRMAGWGAMDHHWLAYWHKRQAEGFTKLSDAIRGGPEHVLGLIASQSSKAASYIRAEFVSRNRA